MEAGFSGNARLTYQTDPYNYRSLAIVAAGVAVIGGISATALASRLGVPRIHQADALVFSLLAGASGALPAIGALMAFCGPPVEPLTLAPHSGSGATDGDLAV
jgi:hypothetical protein